MENQARSLFVLTDYTNGVVLRSGTKSSIGTIINLLLTRQSIRNLLTSKVSLIGVSLRGSMYRILSTLLKRLIGVSLRRRTLHLKLMTGCLSFTTSVLGQEKLKTERSSVSFIEKSLLSS